MLFDFALCHQCRESAQMELYVVTLRRLAKIVESSSGHHARQLSKGEVVLHVPVAIDHDRKRLMIGFAEGWEVTVPDLDSEGVHSDALTASLAMIGDKIGMRCEGYSVDLCEVIDYDDLCFPEMPKGVSFLPVWMTKYLKNSMKSQSNRDYIRETGMDFWSFSEK